MQNIFSRKSKLLSKTSSPGSKGSSSPKAQTLSRTIEYWWQIY